MTYEILRQETIGLSDDKMKQLIDFARFLKQSMEDVEASAEIIPKRKFGCMANSFTFIAPDFDSCFDNDPSFAGLEDYV